MVNTIEAYRSPIRLIKHSAEDAEAWSSQAISRARKKLMAEIALSGDEILIDDVPYSRNDASALLDGMTEEGWKMHSIVYAHEGLLNFLEKEEFTDDELKKADAYLYNDKFVQAVSPYFAHSFNAVSGRLLKEGNFVEMVKLQNYAGYILPEHSTEGYQKIRTYLDELSYTLRNLSWEKFVADESILHFAFSDSWKVFINKLPSSFTTMRDDIVEQLINIVLRFQHKATWHYLHQMLVQLRSIETNDFNRSEVERIDKVIAHNSRLESSGRLRKSTGESKGEWTSGRAIWWGVWIILAIVRAATCNDRSSSSSFNVNDYSSGIRLKEVSDANQHLERQNEKKLLLWLDSLSTERNLAVRLRTMKTGEQPFSGWNTDSFAVPNDSIIISNHTGYDGVYFYFKDWPGHSPEGILPKLYSTYIKRGEAEAVYILPNNGRIYFAFGENWGRLKKPSTLSLSNPVQAILDSTTASAQTLVLGHFFSNKNPLTQSLLRNPVYIDNTPTHREGAGYNYRYLNQPEKTVNNETTKLELLHDSSGFSIKATGRLSVKQELKE